jgi:predicted DNA-binding protein (MmcQ/YjbR family)
VSNDSLSRLREICLNFPDSYEQETWDDPTFRVRSKIFVKAGRDHHEYTIWCKARPGVQEMLVSSDQTRFFIPPYLGGRGWVGVHLGGEVDWDEVADLIEESYRLIAPKQLIKQLDAAESGSFRKE